MNNMTPDDEAFVRAIVAAPGDDLPRLVYADWLDERDDPRGAYLRAEAAWAKSWKDDTRPADDPRLRKMAAGLDPVWVARVSRPPVGVCCDHVRFDCMGLDPGPPLTPSDLNAFETTHDLTLPVLYRAFLLNRNGGYPYPNRVIVPGTDPENWPYIESFGMIEPIGTEYDPDEKTAGPVEVLDVPGELSRLIQVADSDGRTGIYIGFDDPHVGVLFYLPAPVQFWEEFLPVRLADSFNELLAMMGTPDPVWVQSIIRDELPALAAWLSSGGDPNTSDPVSGMKPIEYAVQWGRRQITRFLLDRGATVTRTAWEGAEVGKDREIRAMVKLAAPRKPTV